MITTMMSGDSGYQNIYLPHIQRNAIGHQRAITKSSAPAKDSLTHEHADNWTVNSLHATNDLHVDSIPQKQELQTSNTWNQWQPAPDASNITYLHAAVAPNTDSGIQYRPAFRNQQQFGAIGQSQQMNPNVRILQSTLTSAPDTCMYQHKYFADSTSSRSPSHLAIQSLPMDSSRPLFRDEMDDRVQSLPDHLSQSHISPPSKHRSSKQSDNVSSCGSDESDTEELSHPNKFPVQIEFHQSKLCGYQRQLNRSGEKIKQKTFTTYDPATGKPITSVQHIKYYQKEMARVCRCGSYPTMDGALAHGRSNDCDGYEIHYNLKCRWKAYDDFKSGKRVLICLCKCYKPVI